MPHSYTVFRGYAQDGRALFTTDFRIHGKYAKRICFVFWPLWLVLHAWDSLIADRWVPAWSCGFDTLTVFPDPNPETTSVDGVVYATSTTHAGVHDAASGTALDADDGSGAAPTFYRRRTGTDYQTNRGFFLFDTSALPDGTVIDAATFSLYVPAKYDGHNDAQGYVTMTLSTPASNTAIIGDDYDQLGTVKQSADLDITNITTGAYVDWTLNATGRSNISKTGVTKFGLREGHDLENLDPGANDLNGSGIDGRMADFAGTGSDPKLVITHTDPSSLHWWPNYPSGAEWQRETAVVPY